jgi:hypothetical protein
VSCGTLNGSASRVNSTQPPLLFCAAAAACRSSHDSRHSLQRSDAGVGRLGSATCNLSGHKPAVAFQSTVVVVGSGKSCNNGCCSRRDQNLKQRANAGRSFHLKKRRTHGEQSMTQRGRLYHLEHILLKPPPFAPDTAPPGAECAPPAASSFPSVFLRMPELHASDLARSDGLCCSE